MSTQIHILGSGTPTPTPDRFGSAFAVDVAGELIMVDCGPATTWKLAKMGLLATDVSSLFITHHHFDHMVDYPCFVLTRWDQSIGESTLNVFGPAPTVRVTDQLFGADGAFEPDYNARINWAPSQRVYVNRGGSMPRKPPSIAAHDIEAGFVLETDNWTMRTATAVHAQPHLDSIAYRLETADGSVVFTGDTEECDSVRELAKDADVMLCMSWNTGKGMAEEGITEGCCGSGEAARMASDANVGKLILVHTGAHVSRPEHAEEALREAREFFSGEVVFAEELTSIPL